MVTSFWWFRLADENAWANGPRESAEPATVIAVAGFAHAGPVVAIDRPAQSGSIWLGLAEPTRAVMWGGVTRVSTAIAVTKAAVIGSGRTRV